MPKPLTTRFTELVILIFARDRAVSSRELYAVLVQEGYVLSQRDLLALYHQMRDEGEIRGIEMVGANGFMIASVSDTLMDDTE